MLFCIVKSYRKKRYKNWPDNLSYNTTDDNPPYVIADRTFI